MNSSESERDKLRRKEGFTAPNLKLKICYSPKILLVWAVANLLVKNVTSPDSGTLGHHKVKKHCTKKAGEVWKLGVWPMTSVNAGKECLGTRKKT